MASAAWLANPSLLTIFLLMVPGDSGLISSKDGCHRVALPFAGIVVYKLLVAVIVCVCGVMCALYRKRRNGSAVG